MLTAVGAATWPTGDQVWNGQTAARMPKPMIQQQEGELLLERGEGPRPHEGRDVEARPPRRHVQVDDRRQNERAAREQVQGELHRAVLLARAAPHGDQQVHGEEGDVVPDEDEEQIEAHEEPEDPGDEQEVERVELLHPVFELPHAEHPGEEDDPGQQDHGQAEPVGGVEVADAERRHPGDALGELQPRPARVVRAEDDERQRQRQAGEGRADLLDRLLLLVGKKQNNQQADHAAQQDRGQVWEACEFHVPNTVVR